MNLNQQSKAKVVNPFWWMFSCLISKGKGEEEEDITGAVPKRETRKGAWRRLSNSPPPSPSSADADGQVRVKLLLRMKRWKLLKGWWVEWLTLALLSGLQYWTKYWVGGEQRLPRMPLTQSMRWDFISLCNVNFSCKNNLFRSWGWRVLRLKVPLWLTLKYPSTSEFSVSQIYFQHLDHLSRSSLKKIKRARAKRRPGPEPPSSPSKVPLQLWLSILNSATFNGLEDSIAI